MESPELKAIKINNAAWLPEIAEHVERFCQKAHVDGIQPGNLQTYFAQVAQGWYGRDVNEFWMVFEGDKPVAFACWQILGLPSIAKTYCLCVYGWTKNRQAVDMLADEWIKFGERWNARYWSADFVGKSVARLVETKMKKRGFQAKESGLINIVYQRKV